MDSITQQSPFCWKDIERLDDVHRLGLVLKNLPDEKLMQHLEQERRGGRNEYPVRAVWNSLIAAVVFEHRSIESVRRELKRNGQLRDLCGFDPLSTLPPWPQLSAFPSPPTEGSLPP